MCLSCLSPKTDINTNARNMFWWDNVIAYCLKNCINIYLFYLMYPNAWAGVKSHLMIKALTILWRSVTKVHSLYEYCLVFYIVWSIYNIHNVSETGFVSIIRRKGGGVSNPIKLGTLARYSLDHSPAISLRTRMYFFKHLQVLCRLYLNKILGDK
jgi:hypothetical protein